jgi:ABC-type transport system involved in multi-copper enzyme maturation permease subunit
VTSLSAELLKLRTTRVSYALAAVIVALSGIAAATVVGTNTFGDDRALDLVQAASLAVTVVTIMGILLVTNEYRHGTIATTFLAEPHRLRVLAAKLVVGAFAGVVYAAIAVASIAAVALPWLAARDDALAIDGQAVEAVARLTVSFALAAALGVAVGAVVRSQVGAIVAVFVWFLIVEHLFAILLALAAGDVDKAETIVRYLPGGAFGGIVGATELRGGAAIALAAAYVATLAVGGGVVMVRRDP